MDEKVKQEIIDFLKQDKPDAEKAAELMMKHGTNKTEVQIFVASPSRYVMQIRWALAKLIPISLVDFQKGYFTDIRKQDDYPAVIIRIKEELPKIYEHRAAVQKALTDLGDANDEETKAKAEELGEMANILGVRHQLLQEAKEAYFNSEGKLVPNEEELFPEESNEDTDIPEVKFDWDGDPAAAVKKKKSIESSLTKDRNLLTYQSKTKQAQENPMPEGADKDKVTARIAEKQKELTAIAEFLEPKDANNKAE